VERLNDRCVPWRKSSETTCTGAVHVTVLQTVMKISDFRLAGGSVAISAAASC